MRLIRKTFPPPSLRAWTKVNQTLASFNYSGLTAEVMVDLKEALLKEQGFLCAYTGQQISFESSHIEHLKPQNKCEVGEDVAYRNMVACFPTSGGDVSHGYGAPVKAGWWDPALFVSPLTDECERRFQYVWSGNIHPSPEDDLAAKETISQLGLAADKLVGLRLAAIRGFFGYAPKRKPISQDEAGQLLRRIDDLDHSGKLRPFCFVIKQLLLRYVKKAPAST